MRALVLGMLLLAACRPNDGASQAAPPRGAATDSAALAERDNTLLERADAGRIQGDTSAAVWLVEISDFQCPYCRRWHDDVYPAIKRDYIDKGIVRMAYVHLPLAMHEHAQPAAEASLCASAQGRFWPVHHAIFSTQDRWSAMSGSGARAIFDSVALASGISEPEYRSCMERGVMRRLISADMARAASAGVRPTPTFFVGQERIEGAAPLEHFRAAIARAVSGTPAARP